MGMLKGHIAGIFIVLTIFCILVTAVLLVMNTSSSFLDTIFANMTKSGLMSNNTLNQTRQVTSNFSVFDYMLPFLIIAICITDLVLASVLNSNPVAFAYGFIVMILLVFVSFYVANAIHLMVSQPVFAASTAHFQNTLSMDANLPLYTALFTGFYLIMMLLRITNFHGINEIMPTVWGNPNE